MNRFQLGLTVESLGLPIRSAFEQASRWSLDAVQVNGVGPVSADTLGETGRREFRNVLRSYSLELSAIGCPLRHGLDQTAEMQKRIDNIQKAMKLAYDLGAKKVIVPLPPISSDPESITARSLKESLTALSIYGDRVGTVVCLKPGPNSIASLRDYLTPFESGMLRIAYDPATARINYQDPLAELMSSTGWIALNHIRDVRRSINTGILEEVPLGAGEIDWMAYMATLEAIDFRGPITIERTLGERRIEGLDADVRFLRRFIPKSDKLSIRL